MSRTDAADSDCLADALERIAPALERFYRFEGADPGARRRPSWVAALGEPLPEEGRGLDAVLRVLNEIIIPNGLRNGAPAFRDGSRPRRRRPACSVNVRCISEPSPRIARSQSSATVSR